MKPNDSKPGHEHVGSNGEMSLPCVPELPEAGEAPTPPATTAPSLKVTKKVTVQSPRGAASRALSTSSLHADLKMHLVTMILQQKLELQSMAEQHTKELTSTIDQAFNRPNEDAGTTAVDSDIVEFPVPKNAFIDDDSDDSSDINIKSKTDMDQDSDNASEQERKEIGAIESDFKEKRRAVRQSREHHFQYQLLGSLDTAFWDTAVGVVIILNGIIMLIEAEWKGWQTGTKIGTVRPDEIQWKNAGIFFEVMEHLFTLIFLSELIFKISVFKKLYFYEVMNIFDFLLVAVSVLNMYIFPLIVGGGSSAVDNLTVLRIMRMARLMRTFRMLRTLKLFSGLRVLVKSVASCAISLTWSMVLLLIFMMMGAILMVSLLEDFMLDESGDMEHRLWAWEYYGTSFRATYTMFEVTLSGCWPNYVRPLLQNVSWLYVSFFIIYVTVVVFAVIRIISAIFLKETMDAANSDADMVITERARKKEKYLKKLAKVFTVADESKDGKINEKEFNEALELEIVKKYLQALELDIHESHALFSMLDDGDGEITYQEFIKGVSRLKGQARSIDLIAIQMDAQKILESVQEIKNFTVPKFHSKFNNRGNS